MIMNELNTNLIEAAKERFPAKGQLANILMDTLIIVENNGVYRFTQEGELTYNEAGDWDIKIDIGDLSSLIFGQLSIDELVFLEKLEVKNKEVIKRIREKGIFTLKRNYIQDYQ